ncbi:MAG: DUF3072 domain-containing protein [Silicimonas sp.]|nr:DUF3072 domain-containing protein [Silicimonas sp.]NNF91968.1 DUF3072 domain-containing protein [Boseongicola sp.]RZW08518.1 MAG: DUF3072 domain-containing protein [Paracoccaceae bacterium]MBT8423389.1 DUF3072 domain-containing protein [Silicimonas sp.]NND18961.1 DUF3072 domain-containing protein [Silicimonas sp.]
MTSERPKAAAPTPLSGIASVEEHGDEPMTSEQADKLRALCEQHGKTFDSTLSRDAAARRIADLKGDGGIAPPQS